MRYLFLIIASTICFSVYSQPKVKFGKIALGDLTRKYSQIDSSASAEYLYDNGYSFFKYNKEKGFQFVFQHHRKIKIYNKDGYDYANIEIPFYDPNSENKEYVGAIKAFVYNLEGGKVVKTKLENSEIFEERSSKYWSVKKAALPNVKEGSVLEYTYTITSDFVSNLREWNFQHEIPVV